MEPRKVCSVLYPWRFFPEAGPMTKPLRVVGSEESAPKRKLTLSQAIAVGTLKEQLVALRERIATAIEDPNCPPRDLAALSRRLIEIAREIAAIEVQEAQEAGTATPDEAWEGV